MNLNLKLLQDREKMAIVCLYLARLKSDDKIYKDLYSNALISLSKKYNVKYNTLKQNKDKFDAQFDNGRKGYHQTPLEKSNKYLYEIYIKYKDMKCEDMYDTVKVILDEAENITVNEKIDLTSNEVINNYNVSKVVDYIYNYITTRGYTYEKSLIKNLYISLKTKPFVILSGISGTGKSKIVELFAEALGATSKNHRFNLIPVKPDWSDSTDLLGFRNIEGKFTPGKITDIAYNAMINPELPYFICLDEMNLARVEYYFSDVLSIMETRRLNEENKIITNILLNKIEIENDAASISKYGDVYIPQNLYIIGTVNMDETTFPFSKKVLDRANTIEFNKVDLSYSFDDDTNEELSEASEPQVYHNDFLKSEFLKMRDCKESKDIALATIDKLIEINIVLEKYNSHFGYRVRDEIVFYMIYSLKYELMDFDEAFDFCIVQKILPKISGSNNEVFEILISLFEQINNCKMPNKEYMDESEFNKALEGIFPTGGESQKYKLSNEKLIHMMRRFLRDGFTTFWQ